MRNLYPQGKPGNFTRSTQITRRNRTTRGHLSNSGSYHRLFSFTFLLSLVFSWSHSYSQTGIASFTSQNSKPSSGTTYTGKGGGVGAQPEYIPSSNNTFTYNFGTASGAQYGLLSVNGYIAGNATYVVKNNIITSVVMRRVNNASATGIRDILFFAGNRNPGIGTSGQTNTAFTLNLSATYTPDMSTAFFQNNLLIGTDNIFSNQGNGNGNNNNIERVDVMISNGFKVPDAQKYSFPILERGVYGQHDPFKVAVITALDASGNPSAYTNVISVTTANYNNANAQNPVADGTYNYFLFRRDGSNALEINQHISNQGIGGVTLRFSDFGITNGTKIYGYSILANDFNSASGSDVVDYTNSAHFPTNTSESVGGLDLLAVIGIGFETNILSVEMSSFTATEKNGKSDLQWSTLTEINNRGFAVERSADGRDWKEIGFVPSNSPKGNSSEILQYDYVDNSPITGINYYRLRQLDMDNQEKISQVRILSIGGDNTKVAVFPNPVSDNIYVHGIKPGANLQLIDARGTTIYGALARTQDLAIPANELIPGVYFLQITDNSVAIKTLKVIKR